MSLEGKLRISEATVAIHSAVESALADAADHVLGVSNQHVPHEYGDLEASGRAGSDGDEAFISYDTPYAVRQHEDLSYHHSDGRTAKYLENAINSERDKVLRFIQNRVKGVL